MLPELDFLTLYVNNLLGPLPSELLDCKHLQKVNVYHNQLIGSIPDFGSHGELITFDLFNNLLESKIPKQLGKICKPCPIETYTVETSHLN